MKKINLYKDVRFPLNYISLAFSVKVKKSEISSFALLSSMLIDSTFKYDEERKLALELSKLYGASLSLQYRFFGDRLVFYILVSYLKKDLIDEDITESIIELLNEVIFEEKRDFTRHFEHYKDQLIERIKYLDTEAYLYARKELFKKISPNSYLANYHYGSLSDAKKLRVDDVKKSYVKLIKSPYQIFVQGKIASKYQKLLKNLSLNRNNDLKIGIKKLKFKEQNRIDKHRKVTQTTILSCYSYNPSFDSKERLIASLSNEILGGLSSSYLFRIVREENSLCYEISSSILKNDGLILINAGIKKDDTARSFELIEEIVNTIANDVKQDELDEAKRMMISSLNINADNSLSLFSSRFTRQLNHQDSDYNEDIKLIDKITLDEIKAFLKTLKYRGKIALIGVNENA